MKKISEEDFEELCDKELLAYVSNATPVVWHQMAMEWNYDNSNAFFNWLINNKETDKATALMIYWMSDPNFAKQYINRDDVLNKASWYINDFDFIELLEQKLLNGFFSNSNFAYNPQKDHTGENWTEENPNTTKVREIPAELYKPLAGQIVPEPTNFTEGYPQDLINTFDKLYEEYEID